jgi:hypothetical protein
MRWKCALGHEWNAVIYERAIEGTGCPFCSNQKVLIGFNDLATTHPSLAKEAFGWDPKTVVAGSHKKLQWKCKLGHVWKMQVVNRSRQNQGCSICANKQVLVGVNDLGSTHPEVAEIADGWDVTKFTSGSHVKKAWKCKLGHTWICSIGDLASRDYLCPFCSNRKLWIGFNDLETLFPQVAKEASGWDPSKIHSGSHIKLKWKCAYEHEWSALVSSRVRGSGCPSCATSGFDPNKDGYIYLVIHELWQMLQVGISNDAERRLKEHQKLGWTVLDVMGPLDGHLAKNWESDILDMLRSRGVDLKNEKIAGRFTGYTEAWSITKFSVKTIKQLMRITEDWEESRKSK